MELATLLISRKDVLHNFSSSFATAVLSSQASASHGELEDVGKCGTHRALRMLATCEYHGKLIISFV